MSIAQQLKDIEKQRKQLIQQEKKLREQAKADKAREQKLEQLVKDSGFKTPRELVQALIEKYSISMRGRRKGSTKAAAEAKGQTRRRTRVTAELRDAVKKDFSSGISMNAISKERKISYVVINKICKGQYDKV